MKSNRWFSMVPALAVTLGALPALAAEEGGHSVQPVAVALWNPVQTSDETSSIHGLRLDLPYGKNYELHGLDFGIASVLTHDLKGASFGFGSSVGRDVYGLQSHLVLSLAGGTVYGVQEGIYAEARNLHGVQFGVVNYVKNEAYGMRLGAVNWSGNYSQGATFGIVNRGRRVHGLQLGLVNIADELHGVQIGLANLAKNGFLPFFPVVNAAM